MRTASLFEGARLTLDESIALTAEALRAKVESHRHWALAYSGGKDSSATLAAVVYLVETGQVPPPESLTVLYADTRMELTPLHASALAVLEAVRLKGHDARVVLPEMDQRFFVYMFGRGVPPPKNRFRWCTPQLKIYPMVRALRELRERAGSKLLMLTGVRYGESAARDARIALSCSRDGAECGQGWFQESTPDAVADTLAPIVHWRVCHVTDWLGWDLADGSRLHGLPTRDISEAYGADEDGSDYEVAARTGCVGCNLASRDVALDRLLRNARWSYLAPFKRLKPLYRELTRARNRLRKHFEVNKSGKLAANQGRLGPLTMEARSYGLAQVLAIQDEINTAARAGGRPAVSLINDEEHARIRELMGANTWPQKWDGTEARGDEPFEEIGRDGWRQALLIGG